MDNLVFEYWQYGSRQCQEEPWRVREFSPYVFLMMTVTYCSFESAKKGFGENRNLAVVNDGKQPSCCAD